MALSCHCWEEGGITSSTVGQGWKTVGSNTQQEKNPTIYANHASLLETPTVLYSSISNKSTSVCWDNWERKGLRPKWESKWAWRDKAQRESLSAANTGTVMHQDLTPCLHHSFEWPILYMDTLFCVCVLTLLCVSLCFIMKTFSSHKQEDKINIPV